MEKELAYKIAKDQQIILAGKWLIDYYQTEPAYPVLSVEAFMKNENDWDVSIILQHKDVLYYDLIGDPPKYVVSR